MKHGRNTRMRSGFFVLLWVRIAASLRYDFNNFTDVSSGEFKVMAYSSVPAVYNIPPPPGGVDSGGAFLFDSSGYHCMEIVTKKVPSLTVYISFWCDNNDPELTFYSCKIGETELFLCEGKAGKWTETRLFHMCSTWTSTSKIKLCGNGLKAHASVGYEYVEFYPGEYDKTTSIPTTATPTTSTTTLTTTTEITTTELTTTDPTSTTTTPTTTEPTTTTTTPTTTEPTTITTTPTTTEPTTTTTTTPTITEPTTTTTTPTTTEPTTTTTEPTTTTTTPTITKPTTTTTTLTTTEPTTTTTTPTTTEPTTTTTEPTTFTTTSTTTEPTTTTTTPATREPTTTTTTPTTRKPMTTTTDRSRAPHLDIHHERTPPPVCTSARQHGRPNPQTRVASIQVTTGRKNQS
ncbi:cell wall protein DAN4-like [Portunus trituberculatus]|uniref:cell wall protein DAN4-like n=1 Tax=Portunus trituberculatus TaxID=210409 RepID=UPI001E1D1EFD|nr:cell wall protein DAN4-like [Portunus trituberculatus]